MQRGGTQCLAGESLSLFPSAAKGRLLGGEKYIILRLYSIYFYVSRQLIESSQMILFYSNFNYLNI